MKLNPKSKLVRFAYSLNFANKPCSRSGPRSTTLCAFFWRAFVFMPMTYLVMLFALAGIIRLSATHIHDTLVFLACMVVFSGFSVGTIILIEEVITPWRTRRYRWRLDNPQPPKPPSTLKIFWIGVQSIKRKFCPIISFEA